MDTLSQQYIDWCKGERQPTNTVQTRARTLRIIGNAGTATREEVEAWWVSRADMSRATRANDLANLRAFYRWCDIWEHRPDNPTKRLQAPKVPNGVPRGVDRATLHRIQDGVSPELRRAVCLGAYGGVRISEAAALDWSDIDTDMLRMYIMDSKSTKSRIVKISAGLLDSLLPNVGGNVVTAGGKQYSAQVLQRKTNRAIQRVAPGVTFHRLRHRYGIMAYQATGDLLAVGKQMGHSSPITTAIYAEAATSVADRIADAVMR